MLNSSTQQHKTVLQGHISVLLSTHVARFSDFKKTFQPLSGGSWWRARCLQDKEALVMKCPSEGTHFTWPRCGEQLARCPGSTRIEARGANAHQALENVGA